jgi:hypothetical protein
MSSLLNVCFLLMPLICSVKYGLQMYFDRWKRETYSLLCIAAGLLRVYV